MIAQYNASTANPVPADLVTASESGLDPNITLGGTKFQIPRIAKARGFSEEAIEKIVVQSASYPGGFIVGEPIVNVLELNLQLDRLN